MTSPDRSVLANGGLRVPPAVLLLLLGAASARAQPQPSTPAAAAEPAPAAAAEPAPAASAPPPAAPAAVAPPRPAASPAARVSAAPPPAESRPASAVELGPATQTPHAPAQQSEPCEHRAPPTHAEGFGAFLLGIGFFDFSELSDTLEASGYDRIDKLGTVIGGEGHAVLQSGFVVGGRGAALIYSAVDAPDPFEGEFGGGFGMADFGFAPVRTSYLLFTATVGIGGYGVSLDIQEDQAASFGDVLDDPRRSASLSTAGLLVGLTLGFDARIPLPRDDDEQGRGYFTFGLRVGAMYGPQLADWQLGTVTDVSDAPSGALNGGYAAVTVGFGGGDTYAADEP